MRQFVAISEEVGQALAERRAVVALETTLVAHGFPPGEGVSVGLESERRVRAAGAVPATIGVLDGVAFAHSRFPARRVTLNVAAFNERAITVYERAGFRRTGEHVRTFERWGEVPFVEMKEER